LVRERNALLVKSKRAEPVMNPADLAFIERVAAGTIGSMGVLLFFLFLFIRGDIVPRATSEAIVSRTVEGLLPKIQMVIKTEVADEIREALKEVRDEIRFKTPVPAARERKSF
jgi:hypothetical protein